VNLELKSSASRRTFLKQTAAAVATSVMPRPAYGEVNGKTVNVLYIHSHDSGRYLEPYGHRIPTPSLLRLARGGVLFRQAHCAAPTCSPSRAALLTGQKKKIIINIKKLIELLQFNRDMTQ
jgi:N-sulfoglucosamine sulfohydrolase